MTNSLPASTTSADGLAPALLFRDNTPSFGGCTSNGWKFVDKCNFESRPGANSLSDRLRSLLSLCSPLHKNLNRRFHFNYLHLSTCKITDSKDDCVA